MPFRCEVWPIYRSSTDKRPFVTRSKIHVTCRALTRRPQKGRSNILLISQTAWKCMVCAGTYNTLICTTPLPPPPTNHMMKLGEINSRGSPPHAYLLCTNRLNTSTSLLSTYPPTGGNLHPPTTWCDGELLHNTLVHSCFSKVDILGWCHLFTLALVPG